jgi:flagellar L-ring protein FlgH
MTGVQMPQRSRKHASYIIIFFMLFPAAFGWAGAKDKTKTKIDDPTDIKGYLENAKKRQSDVEAGEGSLWKGSNYNSNLIRDFKARFVDDVVTIKVAESTQALASADAKSTRDTQATAGFDKLFGLENKIKEIPTMVSGKSSSSFTGTGATTRATTLATTMTARVVDILPNGYLVVEGKREIRVNNENQSLYLSGVVRPEDISSGNIVLSSSVAQMSVRVQGKGTVSQPLKPGWLYRLLSGILPF